LWPTAVLAEFHTYQIEEIFSNADGTVQYVVMHESQGMSGEYFWAGNPFISSHAGQSKLFTFPNNLPVGMNCNPYTGCAKAMPTSTANTRVLIATQGFADLQIVAPDFVIPNGFLSTAGGTINYAGADQVTYSALPTDGVTAINRSGTMIPNVATNLFGQMGSAMPGVINYQGLWYKSPAESESGWGINLAHQGDVIFVTWFTYDINGKAWWLTMTATKTAEGVYSGQLVRTNATPFSAFVPPASATVVGTGTLTFTSATNGTFTYTVNDGANVANQTKAIVLQTFGPVPTCVWGAQPDLTKATNYQDLWWAAAGAEPGWGINLTQQAPPYLRRGLRTTRITTPCGSRSLPRKWDLACTPEHWSSPAGPHSARCLSIRPRLPGRRWGPRPSRLPMATTRCSTIASTWATA
jgi:hypothetical protein